MCRVILQVVLNHSEMGWGVHSRANTELESSWKGCGTSLTFGRAGDLAIFVVATGMELSHSPDFALVANGLYRWHLPGVGRGGGEECILGLRARSLNLRRVVGASEGGAALGQTHDSL